MLSLRHLLELFCHVDDFCQAFLPALQARQIQPGKRRRKRCLCESEVMTILIAFHQSHYRDFKAFYLGYVCPHWQQEFPGLVSYSRFIEFVPATLVLLFAYLKSLLAPCSGISFIDSTALAVCHNARISQHKVFADSAQRGKTSVGWFFGFKLHLLINERGELLNLTLTPGNTDDRKPVLDLLSGVPGGAFGKCVGDKGYLSQSLFEALLAQGVTLITKPKKGMKARLLLLVDKLLLQQRSLIETVIDQLKNQCQIEHTRHRATTGFLANLASALIAYCHQPEKPSLPLKDELLLAIA